MGAVAAAEARLVERVRMTGVAPELALSAREGAPALCQGGCAAGGCAGVGAATGCAGSGCGGATAGTGV
ncbi:MAG TPA: hypothetical protein VHM19_00445, partial [Polyangiales bacterium]|nr:hypothetical protein [Polyangiales bacterium]